jgi:hypothetical protein
LRRPRPRALVAADVKRRLSKMAEEKSRNTIADYVGDMVALEDHIEEALDHQLELTKDSPVAAGVVQQFHDMVKRNRTN